jgi:polar amino acid transport system substrate-binding protein
LARHLAAVALLLLALPAFAQDKKPLRWGMDPIGGAPYVYDNNTKGFEVELAALLAEKLGRTSQPEKGPWDKLPDMLKKGELDLVMNGYEYSEQFKSQASIPYYIYRLTATVRADSSVRSWDDLKGKKVGVLGGSAAERYLEVLKRQFDGELEVEAYEDVANTFKLVGSGRLDATVQDNPASAFYVAEDAKRERKLRTLAETRGQGFYVTLTRADDAAFREQVNAALAAGIEDGSVAAIYRRYGLWNDDQERLSHWRTRRWADQQLTDEQQLTGTSPINWAEALKLLGYGALMTVLLAVAAMPLATLLGWGVAAGRLYAPKPVGWALTAYVEVLRGTPLLLQLWVLFYLLPEWISGFAALPKEGVGILGLALNYSASEAEHFRGAFLNLPAGQREAAESLGLSRWAVFSRVLTPQAFRAALPSVTNDFIALFKDTAVCSVIAVMELTKQYNTLYNNHRDSILALAVVTAALYLLMSYPLALVARRLERHFRKGER